MPSTAIMKTKLKLILAVLLCSLGLAAQSVVVSTNSVSFLNATAGAPVTPQTIIVSSTSIQPQQWFSTTTYSTTSGWLTLSTASGVFQGPTPVSVVYSINPAVTAGMSNGTYSASVVYKLLAGGSQTVAVVLCLGSTCGTPPTTSPTSISLTVGQNTTGTATLDVLTGLASTWTGTVSTISGGTWLSINPTGDNVPSQTIVTANTTGIVAGSYVGAIAITSGGGQVSVPVNLTVVASNLPSSANFYILNGFITNGAYNPSLFNFTPVSPGGSLTAATPATITLNAALGGCPVGVNGTDSNHYLYVSAGTGTAEAVLITGGTCTTGAASGTVTFTPTNNHTGSWTLGSATLGLAEAIQAASTTSGGGIINAISLTGAQTTHATTFLQNNISVLLGASTITYTGTGSAFKGSGISNCWVRGLGEDITVIKAQSTGTQKGDMVQYLNTTNCGISDLTLNVNQNATNGLTTQTDTGTMIRNVKILADTVAQVTPTRNYGWHMRGSQYADVDGMEISGGQLDSWFLEADTTYRSILGGSFANMNIHDSPFNCVDVTAIGGGFVIQGNKWVNIRTAACGNANSATSDDQYGWNILGQTSGSIINNLWSNLDINGNYMSGLRIKGLVTGNSFLGVVSQNNGIGTNAGDAINISTDSGNAASDNVITGYARKTGSSKALATSAEVARNVYNLNIGSDSITLGSTKDILHLVGSTDGVESVTALSLGLQAFGSDVAAPSFFNRSGQGPTINSSSNIRLAVGASGLLNIEAPAGTTAATIDAKGGYLWTGAESSDLASPSISNRSGVGININSGAQINGIFGSGSTFGFRTTAAGSNVFQVNGNGSLQFATTGPIILAGSGTPESSVTAVVGSLYLRTNGGAGTTLYVKESGSGNTGWVAK